MKPAGSYAISDIETINMVNGNLALNIPLAALPPGRGGLSASLNLFYNSKIWDIRSVMSRASRSDGTPERRRYNLIPSPDGSWKYGFGYELRVVDRDYESPVPLGFHEGSYIPCNDFDAIYFFKVFIVFPDGSQHEFRLRDQNDREGFFPYRPDGSTTNQCPENFKPLTGTMVYYSMDGTYMRLEVQHDSDSTVSSNPWTLYLSDGSHVTGGSGTQRVYDRNGNYIEIQQHITFNGHEAVQIADQVGRRIVLEYGSAANEDAVHSWSVSGTEVVTRIKWKTISILRSYNNGEGIVSLLTRFKTVIDQITLPVQSGNLAYTFGYNAPDYDFSAPNDNPPVGWGELNSVTQPTGAQSTYAYKLDGVDTTNPEEVLTNAIKSKNLTCQQEYDGASTSVTDSWSYVFDPDSGFTQMNAPDGGVTKIFHYAGTGLGPWFQNLTYKTERPDGSVTESLWNRNTPYGHPTTFYADNPYVKTEFVSIPNAAGTLSQTAIKDYTYDKNGNVTRVEEYDWVSYDSVPRDSGGKPSGIPSGIQPKRITISKVVFETPVASDVSTSDQDSYHFITAPQLLRAVASTEVADSTKTFARSEFRYDDPRTSGNMIESRRWDSTKGALDPDTHLLTPSNSIVETAEYNQFGSPKLLTDARGFKTQLTYDAVGGFPDLYVTKIITAFGTSVARTETREYDFNRGLVTRITDADNNVSTATTYDVFGRPTLIVAAEDKPEETHTTTEYSDSLRRVIVRSDLEMKGDGKLVQIQHYDQLGRVRLTRQLEEYSVAGLTDEKLGIKVQTRYLINNPCQPTNAAQCLADNDGVIGSYVLTSNPYRAATAELASGLSTMGWTRTRTDRRGRAVETQTFVASGDNLPGPWGTNENSTGVVSTAYDGIFTTVTDQAGKVRRSMVNALGQLVRVDEPDANNNLGAQNAPLQATSYQYDVLGDLILVNQGSQTRTFKYTSLARLQEAKNPESGSFTYTYDENGNLKSKTDPRLLADNTTHVVTSYGYDAINRINSRSYNDGTPTVSYGYDAVVSAKGLLTSVSSSVSSYTYKTFDAFGRVKSATQTTDGQDYLMSYEYNLAGALVSQKYPSGRVVKTNYDGAGRLAGLKNDANGNYYVGAASDDAANRIQYSPAGVARAAKLGNGLWEHTYFNSRLQTTQIGLGSTGTTSGILQLDYSYGSTNNNGNVQTHTITVPTIGTVNGFTATQTYSYDSLNRLATATESNNSWTQNFDYDRYGNRKFIAGTTLPSSLTSANNPIIDPNNNRLDKAVSGQTNVLYDDAGNLTKEVGGHTYEYDAENEMVSYDSGATTGGGASYSYDGNGNRVKKVVGGATLATTIFVYDFMGQLIAEYASTGSTGEGTSYVTGDTLASPRVITDANQKIRGRHDYLPFGEELFAGTGGRTGQDQQNFGADNLRQKFTRQERDNETGFDYFLARYYSSSQGRFTSTDPLAPSARIVNPQSFNRYSYTLNNPVRYVDPLGLDTQDPSDYKPEFRTCKVGVDAGCTEKDTVLGAVTITGGGPTPVSTSNPDPASVSITPKPLQGGLGEPLQGGLGGDPEPGGGGLGWGVTGNLSALFGVPPIGGGGSVGGFIGQFGGFGEGERGTTGAGLLGGANFGLPIGQGDGGGFSWPAQQPGDFAPAIGKSAGASLGLFVTNAKRVEELRGPFFTIQINTPFGNLEYDVSGNVRVFSITNGWSVGGGFWMGRTTTVTTPSIPLAVPVGGVVVPTRYRR